MKKVYMGLICSLLFAGMVSANTNIAVWVGGDTPTTFISGSGYFVAPYFVGNGSLLTDVVGVGSTLPTAYIWVGGATSNAAAKAVSGDITITTNGVVAVASLPAISGAALTGLASANLAGNIVAARLTNAFGVSAALIAVTNRGTGYTNVITFFGTFSGDVEP